MTRSAKIDVISGLLLLLPILGWAGFRCYKVLSFDINCGGHLKRAADANNLSLAKQELDTALVSIERNNMTHGYTSLLINTPDEDVGFWYSNLKASSITLNAELAKPNVSELEVSNVLMKLRQTLLDHGAQGEEHVTCPSGISVYPYNFVTALFGVISILLAMVGINILLGRLL